MKNLIIFTLSLFILFVSAQHPVWQGKGRIVISSDGNEHDHDDWAATPMTLALLAAAGLQDRMVLYTYSDHVWGSNFAHPGSSTTPNAYEQMKLSALGGQKWFGFDKSTFICAVDSPEVAYNALRDEIDKSSNKNPLIIIAAGPMQVVGEAISRANKDKRQFITIISHSRWNNEHSNKPSKNEPVQHSGWTFKMICDSFACEKGGNLKPIQILDQNGGDSYNGFMAAIQKFDWVRDSQARNNKLYKPGAWDWLYSRLQVCVKQKGTSFDPSDAGMIIYLLTGIEETEPEMAQKIMENPKKRVKAVK